MSARVYVLLDIPEDRANQVVRVLRSKAGVVMADVLEGSPNVIIMIQACDRQKLAELTNRVLASVESETEGLQLLPTRNGCSTYVSTGPFHTGRTRKETPKKERAQNNCKSVEQNGTS